MVILAGQLDIVRVWMDVGVQREEDGVVWAADTKDRERAVAVAAERKVRVEESCCCLVKERVMEEEGNLFMDMIRLCEVLRGSEYF